MPELKLLPIVKSVIIGLIFFAIGRLMVLTMGTKGIWIALILVIGFYVIWWVSYQRGKRK